MGIQIESAKGNAFGVEVNSKNRLAIQGVVKSVGDDETEDGRGFNFNTRTVTMTTANESGLAYLSNNGSTVLVIEQVSISLGLSTGGAAGAVGTLRWYRNPTGGTLVSGGTDRAPVNRRFNSTRTLSGTFKAGDGSALTLTGGTQFSASLVAPADSAIDSSIGALILSPGNSIGFTYQPPAANTSQAVVLGVRVHEETI